MNKFTFLRTAKTVSLLLFVALIAVSCDNSTSSEEEDHSDPEGFRLVMNGITIVERLPGETTHTGDIELEPGEESAEITIWFLDDDGDQFHPEGDEYSLGYEFEDSGIVEFEQHDGEVWEFHLHAEDVEDHTEMTLMLMHNDHSDFETGEIHIHVETEEQP